jgi:hypothetical protein
MNKLTTMFLTASMLLAAGDAPKTFIGTITDSMCGMDHKMMDISPDSKCARECVKSSTVKYILFDGKNNYKLSDQKTPEQFAAQRVKVTGTLFPKTGVIKVDKIEPAK